MLKLLATVRKSCMTCETPIPPAEPAAEVLTFWFEELDAKQWFSASAAVDDTIRQRFFTALSQAAAGELQPWRETPQGRLAEIIVLDQFSRNIHRNAPQAFAQDPVALVLAQEAVAARVLQALNTAQCGFLLMPYMHSESSQIHAAAEALFKAFASKTNHRHEVRHKAIIDRFGRYPHRNAVLQRPSTPEELDFLEQPGSRV